jgi:hypothetical protein
MMNATFPNAVVFAGHGNIIEVSESLVTQTLGKISLDFVMFSGSTARRADPRALCSIW